MESVFTLKIGADLRFDSHLHETVRFEIFSFNICKL